MLLKFTSYQKGLRVFYIESNLSFEFKDVQFHEDVFSFQALSQGIQLDFGTYEPLSLIHYTYTVDYEPTGQVSSLNFERTSLS